MSILKVRVSDEMWKKLRLLTDYSFEIAGWLTGRIENHEIIVEDLLIPPQNASGAEVTMDIDSIQWIIKNHKDKMGKIIGHWHSHNYMTAFFSGGDEANHKIILEGRRYALFIVTALPRGKEFEYVSKVCLKEPIEAEVDAEIVVGDDDTELKAIVDAEVQEKVTTVKHSYQGSITNYTGYRDRYDDPYDNLPYTRLETPPIKSDLKEFVPTHDLTINDIMEDEVTQVKNLLKRSTEFGDIELIEETPELVNNAFYYTIHLDTKTAEEKNKLLATIQHALGQVNYE